MNNFFLHFFFKVFAVKYVLHSAQKFCVKSCSMCECDIEGVIFTRKKGLSLFKKKMTSSIYCVCSEKKWTLMYLWAWYPGWKLERRRSICTGTVCRIECRRPVLWYNNERIFARVYFFPFVNMYSFTLSPYSIWKCGLSWFLKKINLKTAYKMTSKAEITCHLNGYHDYEKSSKMLNDGHFWWVFKDPKQIYSFIYN